MKPIIELVIGDLDEKRAYRHLNERAKKLPKDHYAAFKKIRAYLYKCGEGCADLDMLSGLVDLLESGAAQGKSVAEVVGADAAAFCDELILAANTTRKTMRNTLNQEIEDYFNRQENEDDAEPHQTNPGR